MVCSVVLANLLAITHGVAIWLGKLLQCGLLLSLGIFAPRRQNFVDISPLGCELLLKEYGQIDLAHKADALRIFTLGGCQFLLLGNASHLGF